ncbi:MAG: hypothetical protein GY833_12360 [Aestuariibacter sp.]|nr:hypothetical protein [Aestuariibacter sp.]|tara:strand:+ start:66948 stop:67589 length:642 start_codon:yes stop_codon:yes gene_type:complete
MAADKIDVYSTPSMVVWQLLQELGQHLPNATALFQPNLSYRDGLEALRAQNDKKQVFDTTALPLLLFNRSTLRSNEVFGKRSRQKIIHPKDDSGTDHTQLKVLMGEFDFRFLYVTTQMEELERFEMLYSTSSAVKNEKRFKLHIPALDDYLEYKVEWESLEDFQLSIDEGYYKTIGAQAKVRGAFIVSTGESLARIKNIFTGGAVQIHIKEPA